MDAQHPRTSFTSATLLPTRGQKDEHRGDSCMGENTRFEQVFVGHIMLKGPSGLGDNRVVGGGKKGITYGVQEKKRGFDGEELVTDSRTLSLESFFLGGDVRLGGG